MRKKNVPKSSTDVTDSNGASNSEDEIAESKSSESEEEIRTKRKRIVVKKSSNDDDDEDYPKPWVIFCFPSKIDSEIGKPTQIIFFCI